MESKAYYAVEVQNYSDLTLEDLIRVLAILLMPKPYLWRKVKFVNELPKEYEEGPSRFLIVFNDLLSNDEYSEFSEILNTGESTSAYGLSI